MITTHDPRLIVVVDDEKIVAETIALILNRNGFKARWFSDPTEALLSMIENPPHLLLSDLLMPQISGLELAARVAALLPKCKIVLLSGHALELDEASLDVIRKSGHLLLSKPLHPALLIEEISCRLQ